MYGNYIGKYIQKKRKEFGLSQEALCENICDSSTMSRFERGIQMLSHDKICALLQRLGLPKHYAYFPSQSEIIIEDLKNDIVSLNIHSDRDAGQKILTELENIAPPEDTYTRQFILRCRSFLGTPNAELSFDEKIQMLMDAIKLTSPKFELKKIRDGTYTLEEIKCINQIGVLYSQGGNRKMAISIFEQLYDYLKNYYRGRHQSYGHLTMVTYNYALELSKIKLYSDALGIAEEAWHFCTKYGHYQYLASSIDVCAKCHHFLGDNEKSKSLYRQAYALYQALGDERNGQSARESVMEYLGEDIAF